MIIAATVVAASSPERPEPCTARFAAGALAGNRFAPGGIRTVCAAPCKKDRNPQSNIPPKTRPCAAGWRHCDGPANVRTTHACRAYPWITRYCTWWGCGGEGSRTCRGRWERAMGEGKGNPNVFVVGTCGRSRDVIYPLILDCATRQNFMPALITNESNCERRRPPGRRTEHEKRASFGFGKRPSINIARALGMTCAGASAADRGAPAAMLFFLRPE